MMRSLFTICCSFLSVIAVIVGLGMLLAMPAPALAEAVGTTASGVEGRLSLLRDPSRALTLADILSRDGEFGPLATDGFNLGNTRDAAWLRMSLDARDTETALLSLGPAFVDIVDVYVVQRRPGLMATDFTHYALGDHRPLLHDANSALDSVVPLGLVAGETTLVYIRAASVHSSLVLVLSLYPAEEHSQRTTLTSLSYGFWFGGMATLMLIQLVFFYFDRKPFYLLLAVSTLCVMLIYCANLGIARVLLFSEGGRGHDVFHAGAVWLGFSASALMTASVLELRKRSRWLLRLFQFGAVLGVVGFAMAVAGYNLVFVPWGNIAIIILATLAMVQSLGSLKERGLAAGLPAAAFTVLWVGLLATLAQRSGIFPLPNWVSQSYGISSLLYTILLTAALGVRLSEAEKHNKTMQEAALVAAREAEESASALVAERTRELAAAKKTAEDALQSELQAQTLQVRFVEVLSHQYRTPLASIRSNIDTIALSLPASDMANLDRVNRVRRGVARLVEVVELNLARSRLQGASFKPVMAVIGLGAPVEMAAARGRDLALAKDVRVDISPSAIGARLRGDAEMLTVAIINLLDNAVKFSAAVAEPVTLSCRVEGGYGVISVADHGIGIPQAELDAVRARSYRAANTDGIEGTGLGLSLVQRIVDAHRGELVIASEEGVSTTVSIRLPLVAG